MRRSLSALALILAASALTLVPSEAAVKAGTSCKQISLTTVVSGYKYTCVKSGKKLLWSKGVKVVVAPKPTASPTPTPSASATTTPTPTPTVQPAVYSAQWTTCTEPFNDHDGWVIGMNANRSEFTYLRCTNSKNQDGSPAITWQIPIDAAKIDQTTKLPISGSGFIPAPVSTPTPTPTPTQSAIAVPTSFSDLYEKRSGIAYSVWSKVNAKLLISAVQLPPIEIYRGPTTPIYIEDPAAFFKQVLQLFPGIALPKKIVVFYWNYQDADVMATKALSIMGKENDQKNFDETTGPWVTCYSQTSCPVGHALIGLDGTAYLGIGLSDSRDQAERSGGGKGGTEKVEFYHALQLLNYHTNSLVLKGSGQNIQSPYFAPIWLSYGAENLVSDSLKFSNNYLNFKNNNRYSDWTNQAIPNFSIEWINNYLSISYLGNKWSDASSATATPNSIMGAYLTEIFVALKGPSVMLDFYDQMSKKVPFADVFQNIFGVSWQTAQPEIAKVIYDRHLNNY